MTGDEWAPVSMASRCVEVGLPATVLPPEVSSRHAFSCAVRDATAVAERSAAELGRMLELEPMRSAQR